nr:uncharacterized protein LOC115255446 [Aedes albopictus]
MGVKNKIFLLGFSAGAIPFLNESMTYQVTEEDAGDEPADQPALQQRDTSQASNNGNYQSNLALSSTPVFARSKSDLNMANSDSVSNSPTTSSGYVEPHALGYSSTTMVPVTRPTTSRIRRAASILPPIPPRDMDVVTHRRVNSNSEANPYDFSKSIAESAMDISLLTANANQLRLLITYNQGSQTYMACITFIIMSLVLQMLVAVTMIIVSLMKQNLMDTTRQKLKIITSVGVAIITMINILVASLVVAETPSSSMSARAGTIMMMEAMPATLAATVASTTAMPLITSTIGAVSASTVGSSTVETLLDGGLSTLASNLLANITARKCKKKHKYYAKLSIDTGLLVTTLIQLRLVLRADKESYPILVYVLLGLITLSLVFQVLIMMLYIFVHYFKNRADYPKTKFVITEMIFIVTILNAVCAVLLEALLEPK